MDPARAREKLKDLFFSGILHSTPTQPPKIKNKNKGKTPLRYVSKFCPAKERKALPPFVPWYRLEAQAQEKEQVKEEAKKTRKNTLELSSSDSSVSGSVSRNNSPTNESITPPTTMTRTSLDTPRPSTITNDSKSKTGSDLKSDSNSEPIESEPTPKSTPQSASMTLTPILPGLNISTSPSALDKMLSISPPSTGTLETLRALEIKHNYIPLEIHALQDLLKHFGLTSDYIDANAPWALTSFSLRDVENRYVIDEDKAARDAARARARGLESTGPSGEKGSIINSSEDAEEEEEGDVLVYCDLDNGQGVAITVLAAFIIRQFGVLADPALKFIETRLRPVELSPHLIKQLDIWVGVHWKVWADDRIRRRVRKPLYEDFLVGTLTALAVDCVDEPFDV
ncbi:hypothetical protein BDW69DRAFT_132687 [Aspergillus filifer]